EIKFPLAGIHALLLTHVHIDHAGRIPYLLAAGFKGPIYCSKPTAELLPMVMQDALKIGFTKNRRMIKQFLEKIDAMLRPIEYGKWQTIEGDNQIRLSPAGHVLGSCYFEVQTADDHRVVFSGDLGAKNAPLLNPAKSPESADLMVLESTYGDKLHPPKENRQRQLEDVLCRTLENKGVTIIPAFSLGRTQALLFELNNIFEQIQHRMNCDLMRNIDVIVDSPLASRFTEIYKRLKPYWGAEAQAVLSVDDAPLVFDNLVTVGNHNEHRDTLEYLAQRKLPAIVIAGSGMCTGGRVVNYLKKFIGREDTDILFVGYQAGGTPGHYIQRVGDWVRINGRKYTINAGVHTITGYSAHGDQADLVDFAQQCDSKPKHIRLVHGEYDAKSALQTKLQEEGFSVD
ncbi:MAG: MBL fold metallo-hydrolase, partial [Planctomycetota bacterium]